MRWVIDGMNVIGSRPDGWWRDRPAAQRRLHERLERFATESGEEVRLVLDGRRPAHWPDEEGVETSFARGGPNAADDAIVELVQSDPDPGSLRIVTSDRALAERVRELGAEVAPSSSFRERIAM